MLAKTVIELLLRVISQNNIRRERESGVRWNFLSSAGCPASRKSKLAEGNADIEVYTNVHGQYSKKKQFDGKKVMFAFAQEVFPVSICECLLSRLFQVTLASTSG